MLIKASSEKYFFIFEEEEQTYNSETNMGKYGIWAHELGELDLAGIEVFKNEDGKI